MNPRPPLFLRNKSKKIFRFLKHANTYLMFAICIHLNSPSDMLREHVACLFTIETALEFEGTLQKKYANLVERKWKIVRKKSGG